jgi:hypothetical protein
MTFSPHDTVCSWGAGHGRSRVWLSFDMTSWLASTRHALATAMSEGVRPSGSDDEAPLDES